MKITLLLFFVAIVTGLSTIAAAPAFDWAVQERSGTTNDEGFTITADSRGNTYVAGVFTSRSFTLGAFTVTNFVTNLAATNFNLFVAKFDPFGNVAWATSVGGSSNDGPNSIAVDAAGNAYLTGIIGSPTPRFGSLTITNNNSNLHSNGNMFLAKLDTNGVPLWVDQATLASSNASGYQVAVDGAGNGCVLGIFFGSLGIAGTNFNSANGTYFLTRFNSSGTLSNAIQFGDSLFFASGRRGLGLDAADNIYVAGTFSSNTATFGATTLTNFGTVQTGDIFLFKLDTNENYVWIRQCGGNGSDNATAMAIDAAGNTYLNLSCLGDTNKFGSITLTTNTGDRFVAKFDSSGNALWVSQAAVTGSYNSGTVGMEAIGADAAGNCFVGGHSTAAAFTFGTIGFTNATLGLAEESFVMEFDSAGHPQWSRSLAGTNAIIAMAVDSGDHCHVTGWFKQSVNLDAFTLSGANYEQAFVADLNSTNASPRLSITSAGNNALLFWPTNRTNFSLYSETNLNLNNWSPATGTVTTVGTNFVVTNSLAPSPRFYRLHSP